MKALITGGTRGIGLGIAKALATKGIDLVLSGQRPFEEVENEINDLKKLGINVDYFIGDISNTSIRQELIEYIEKRHADLNIIINNAGVAPKQRFDILETTEESYERVMDTNLKSQFFLSQGIAKLLIIRKLPDSCIINVSSVSATIASVNRAEYCISKAGIAMSTQLFALRLAEYGIGVFEIRPGIIKTDMTATVIEKYDQLIAKGLIPENRWGNPEDIGKAVAAIVQGDFKYSTGNVFMIDGGLSLAKL
jgi:3-oxoacyl-[acyl-carrier protein] reductase